MAAATQSRRKFSPLYFIQLFYIVTLVLDKSDAHYSSPAQFLDVDNSYLSNADLSKTFYHVSKRSILTPPIKKATSSSEKKLPLKNLTTETYSIPKISNKSKSSEENTTVSLSSTEGSTSTLSPFHLDINNDSEKYNLSTGMPLSTNSTTESEAIISSITSTTGLPATSSSATPSTATSDELPTRPSTITNTTEDYHVYYNSTLFLEEKKAMTFWVDFDRLPQHKIVVHRMLSDSYRKAATVSLSFDFPFYGHPLRNITIATGGFIYMGDYMHSWLAATQYIAPLMANFDTSLNNESTVRYFDNGTAFVIEWHQVSLQDEKEGRNFTFQATLLGTGDVVFVYDNVPLPISKIGDDSHPVKVGLSDAYVIDRMIYFIRRKTIYEYHRIDMLKDDLSSHTAIYFTALPTCMSFQDCKSCMAAETNLECVWCEAAKRCSDGLDRMRQVWIQYKCIVDRNTVNCSNLPKPDVNPFVQPLTDSPFRPYTSYPRPSHNYETTSYPRGGKGRIDDGAATSARVADNSSSVGVGSVVGILLILGIVLGGLMWVGYAYRNPHTSSGQMLIRYRPSQWRFRSGEARYTAASVHM